MQDIEGRRLSQNDLPNMQEIDLLRVLGIMVIVPSRMRIVRVADASLLFLQRKML
jgi:hypothetical protein